MAFQVNIRLTNSADGITVLPSDSTLIPVSKGNYTLADSAGLSIDDLGLIPLQYFIDQGLIPVGGSAYFSTVSHASASLFSAGPVASVGGGSFVSSGPDRSVDTSAAGGGFVGPFALVTASDCLKVESNFVGTQIIVLKFEAVGPGKLVDVNAAAFIPDVEQTPFVVEAPIPDIRSATADSAWLEWPGPTCSLDSLTLVASNTIAGADLVVSATIAGVAITPGTLTIPVTSVAGTAVTITPTSANIVGAGDMVRFQVTGLGQTAVGHASVGILATPIRS